MPKVSLLIPIYGVAMYIEQCARSLFEQTYHNIEYIFVNDCTKDKSVEILLDLIKEYPNRKNQIKIVHHHKNRGLSAARNTAIENMTGDYLWHIDSDDYISLNAVELLVKKAQKTNAEVIIFGHNKVYPHKIVSSDIRPLEKHEYIQCLLLNSIPASMWNKFYNSSFYRRIRIQSIEGINQGEDYAVVPRILYQTSKITWVNTPLYFYNLKNQDSYSQNISLNSIVSQKKADDVLYDFFKDIDSYKHTLGALHLRSMLFLIKTSNKDQYQNIIQIYKYYLHNSSSNLSLLDKTILFLIKNRLFGICYTMIFLHKKIFK